MECGPKDFLQKQEEGRKFGLGDQGMEAGTWRFQEEMEGMIAFVVLVDEEGYPSRGLK